MSSTTTTPNDSPVAAPIQPLHNPSHAAHVVVPQAPLGNVVNQVPGMGAKALLAKKMVKTSRNAAYHSPTDNLMTPCTQKLSAAKKKHFSKTSKPLQLFAPKEENSSDADVDDDASPEETAKDSMDIVDDDENPF